MKIIYIARFLAHLPFAKLMVISICLKPHMKAYLINIKQTLNCPKVILRNLMIGNILGNLLDVSLIFIAI
uniref:Putative product n=1 Tax=Xenopsylla cheopis TaxID=163159 RepID=A0A6M2DVL1_XENCH